MGTGPANVKGRLPFINILIKNACEGIIGASIMIQIKELISVYVIHVGSVRGSSHSQRAMENVAISEVR